MILKNKEENEDGLKQMGLHLRWLNLAGVDEAPVTFLNKTEIPKQYQSHELGKLLAITQTVGFANQT